MAYSAELPLAKNTNI